jgi:hypothetical protein
MKRTNNYEAKNSSAAQIPLRVSNYLKKYFDGKDFSKPKLVKRGGQVYYKIDVNTGTNIYRLKFSSLGLLMEKVMEPLFDTWLDETGTGD